MGYFSKTDIQALNGKNASEKEQVQQRFLALHKKVFEQIQVNDIDLNLLVSSANAVSNVTVSQHEPCEVLTVQYTRTKGQAVTVERLMGREEVASVNNLIVGLHPVIELRLSEAGFAVELIVSPDAWWDQGNLKGKLSIQRHKHEFYTLLMRLGDQFCMGFWQGIHLSEMHLVGKYFQHPRILDEWLGTFHPNADWFRIGVWYEPDNETLSDSQIIDELIDGIQALYPVYHYLMWTSENNFRDFLD